MPRKCTESNKDWELQIESEEVINEVPSEQQLQYEPTTTGGETETDDLGNTIDDTTNVSIQGTVKWVKPAAQQE